ncbi:CLUMA_CG001635, isoform A [Clunio marinus]|uniref:CLUMA_CG001635, isoform A n=1 Tax=Clunio marinus TaxID=568069 RepID=A0A1J1HIG9_9DIPT|nr:CLUMA_CG001635, isoform A [Clunio marinus]
MANRSIKIFWHSQMIFLFLYINIEGLVIIYVMYTQICKLGSACSFSPDFKSSNYVLQCECECEGKSKKENE